MPTNSLLIPFTNTEFGFGTSIDISGNELNVTRNDDTKRNRALHGLYRSLIHNMVSGENAPRKPDFLTPD